jgi:Na+-transporting NADH:ubiquinone oxidoreductase subunit NqrA
MKHMISIIGAGVFAALLSFDAAAAQAGVTKQGRPFVSGGVSTEELVALHGKREAYSLWVVTAAKRSGAHLSDAVVKITDASKNTVFDGRLVGPWLFVDLPLGRYDVEARFNGESQKRVTTIHSGDLHQALFYFDVPAEVSPEWQSPFPRGPYTGK